MPKGILETVRIDEVQKNMVIMDFDDDWHCAIRLHKGMSKTDLVGALHRLQKRILSQIRFEAEAECTLTRDQLLKVCTDPKCSLAHLNHRIMDCDPSYQRLVAAKLQEG